MTALTPQPGDYVLVRRDDGVHHRGKMLGVSNGLIVYRINGRKSLAHPERVEVSHRPRESGAA